MTHAPGRMPSLDGFRAVSILMVLCGHLGGTRGFPVTAIAITRWIGDLGALGVQVFFVISGFLITSLLMDEREQTGTISLKNFYLRRVLRIFPASYSFILALLIATMLGWVSLTGRDFAFAATYTVNYYPHHPWQIGHLWSLSVEEQFYLLWPLALLLLRERRGLLLAIAAIFIGPVVRAAITGYVLRVNPASPLSDMSIFPAMCDYLATGCALALLRPWLLTQDWYLRLTGSRWLWLAVPLIFLINRGHGYTAVMFFGSPVQNVCIALLIESMTRHHRSLPGRVFNWGPVAFLGVLSYSLYLWQQPFINRHSDAWINAFPQNVVLAFIAALLSYFLVERAFLRLRKRLRQSAGTATGEPGVESVAAPADRAQATATIPGHATIHKRELS